MSDIPAVDVQTLNSLQRQAKDHFTVGRLAGAAHLSRQGWPTATTLPDATGRRQLYIMQTLRHGSGCWGKATPVLWPAATGWLRRSGQPMNANHMRPL